MKTPFARTLGNVLGSMLLASSFLTACAPSTTKGGGTGTNPTGSDVTYEVQTPTISAITAASPTPAIGDTIHVFGSNFIDPKHGQLVLAFDGTFTDQDGNTTRTPDGAKIPLTYVGAGEATFILGPDNVFGPPGTIGQFTGNFRAANQLEVPAVNGEIGDLEVSSSLATSVTVGPSIFLDELRSVDPVANCQGVTPSTSSTQNIRLGFHFVGMDDASTDDPVYYTITYDNSQMTVAYVGNQQYGSWPFWGPTAPNAMGATVLTTGIGSFSDYATSGNGTTFDPQTYQQTVSVNPPVTINQQQQSMLKLAGFATNSVPVGTTQSILFTITAQHKSGTKISRLVNWSAKGQVSMTQPTPTVLVAWDQAQLSEHNGIVKGSLPNGTDVNYNESTSDSKTRTINMSWNVNNSQQINANLSGTLGLSFGVQSSVTLSAGIAQTWSQTFGTDVSQSDSVTTQQGSSETMHVNPGMYGAFYLQWGEQNASVQVTLNDACGGSVDLGTATLVTHVPYIAAETSAQNPPPCPTDANDCHAVGPVSN